MTIVVPYDGSELSNAALERAADLSNALDNDLIAISIIPGNNAKYARENGWLEEDEQFDSETIVTRLSEMVDDVAPTASFRYATVDKYAPAGVIAKRIRKEARLSNARLVALGSDNAGRIVTNVSSVAGTVAADDAYDVLIVRHGQEGIV